MARDDRFLAPLDKLDHIEPQCLSCKHFTGKTTQLTCEAFPMGIPLNIYTNKRSHKRAVDGDNGIHWEPRVRFTP